MTQHVLSIRDLFCFTTPKKLERITHIQPAQLVCTKRLHLHLGTFQIFLTHCLHTRIYRLVHRMHFFRQSIALRNDPNIPPTSWICVPRNRIRMFWMDVIPTRLKQLHVHFAWIVTIRRITNRWIDHNTTRRPMHNRIKQIILKRLVDYIHATCILYNIHRITHREIGIKFRHPSIRLICLPLKWLVFCHVPNTQCRMMVKGMHKR